MIKFLPIFLVFLKDTGQNKALCSHTEVDCLWFLSWLWTSSFQSFLTCKVLKFCNRDAVPAPWEQIYSTNRRLFSAVLCGFLCPQVQNHCCVLSGILQHKHISVLRKTAPSFGCLKNTSGSTYWNMNSLYFQALEPDYGSMSKLQQQSQLICMGVKPDIN